MSSTAEEGLLCPVSAGTAAESLTGDEAVLRALVRAEQDLLRSLVEVGIAPAAAGSAADALGAVPLDPRRLALDAVDGGNPVIPLVDRLRAAADPDLARWVHFGATSQDILDTALMLVTADALRRIDADLTSLADALAGLADRSRSVPMVARTLGQQALPTTLAMRASVWLAGVHDAIRSVRRLVLPASLGGPVGTGSAYGAAGPDVVNAFARRLGLGAAAISWHTRRAPVLDVAHTLVLTGAACGKIAADVLVMSQAEVAEAREPGRGPSSSMPHKANPAVSVLLASAARQLPPLASVLGWSAVAEQERPAGAWHAEWQPLRHMLRLAGGSAERAARLVPGLHFDEAAMRRNLERLQTALGAGHTWIADETRHTQAWVDRVLADHRELA